MKKSLSLLIAVLLWISIIPVSAASFSDLETSDAREEAELLCDLGILIGKSETEFDPDSDVTRAEMAVIIMRLLGMNTPTGVSSFKDVPSSHFASAHIAAATQMGIIHGIDAETFLPDAPITLAQAVKMLVVTLGYSDYAESQGGYPTGYLAQAIQLGLIQGIPTEEATVSRETMALLLANVIDCEILVRISYGEARTYEQGSGKTLLSEYLDIYKYKGVVTDTHYETIAGNVSVGKNQIALDSLHVFDIGNTAADTYLGYNVIIYAKNNERTSVPEIVSIAKTNGTSSVTLNANDILPGSTGSKLHYEWDGSEKVVDIPSSAYKAYNGTPASAVSFPAEGSITIISYRNTVSTVLVYAYTPFTVKYVDASTNTVYFQNVPQGESSSLKIDPEEVLFLNADGSKASVESCSAWDILSVFKDASSNVMRVVRADTWVVGEVTEISEDSAVIDGDEYTISKTLRDNTALTQPYLGLIASFHLDHNNKIAALNEDGFSDYRYGYLLSVFTSKGINGKLEIKLFTDEGVMQAYSFPEKVVFRKGMSAEVFVDSTALADPIHGLTKDGKEVVPQLLRYEENEMGEITKLETYATKAEYTSHDFGADRETRQHFFTMDAEVDSHRGDSSVPFIGGKTKTFLSRYHLDDNCVIFNIPSVPSNVQKDYAVILPSSLVHGTYYANIQFYDVKKDNTISAIVIKAEIQNIVKDDAFGALITGTSKTIDEDGSPVTKLHVVNESGNEMDLLATEDLRFVLADQNNSPSAVILNPKTETQRNGRQILHEISADALNPGDLIAYVERNGTITAGAVRFRAKAPIEKELALSSGVNSQGNLTENYAHGSQIIRYGTVVSSSDTAMLFECPVVAGDATSGTRERLEPFDGATIVEFDMQKNTYTFITSDAILEGDKVLTYRVTNTPMLIVRYKNI